MAAAARLVVLAFAPASASSHHQSRRSEALRRGLSHLFVQGCYLLLLAGVQGLNLLHVSVGGKRGAGSSNLFSKCEGRSVVSEP